MENPGGETGELKTMIVYCVCTKPDGLDVFAKKADAKASVRLSYAAKGPVVFGEHPSGRISCLYRGEIVAVIIPSEVREHEDHL